MPFEHPLLQICRSTVIFSACVFLTFTPGAFAQKISSPSHLTDVENKGSNTDNDLVVNLKTLKGKKAQLHNALIEINRQLITLEYLVIDSTGDIPIAIKIRRDDNLIQAWHSIRAAQEYSEQKVREGGLGLPEPYFAEAMLWGALGHHEKAIAQFVVGSNIALENKDDLTSQVTYFKELQVYLNKYLLEPRKVEDEVTSKTARLVAQKHFSAGLTKFKQGKYSEAAPLFTEAVLLNPEVPWYWYYRAGCFKELKFNTRAKHDAMLGITLEIRNKQSREAGHALECFQGSSRLWLESVRRNLNIPTTVYTNETN